MDTYDFCGYVTKNDLKCSDGRVIRQNAFMHNDGKVVPLVWQHLRNDPKNVLGHVILQNRKDGVYGYGYFNESDNAEQAKELLSHGDINSMSIYANNLRENGSNVLHGDIKEVSLVLAGANPGAKIDFLSFEHSDGTIEESSDEAFICYSEPIDDYDDYYIEHEEDDSVDENSTVEEVWNSLTDLQKNMVYALIANVAGEEGGSAEQSDYYDDYEEGDFAMKYNVFDKNTNTTRTRTRSLTHDEFTAITEDAKKCGSLKEAFLAHIASEELPNGEAGVDYGIANLDLMFPDYRDVRDTPDMIKRDDEWVAKVIGGTHKVPFSKIKTTVVDVTADVARARGYQKGHYKKEELIKMAKRTTGPTTIYKKQRLDHDDITDLNGNWDVVVFLKSEMQMMLREELARAILIGDGRDIADDDKIDESCIRPIAKEDPLYAFKMEADLSDYVSFIDDVALAMVDYKGSGTPTLFIGKKDHTRMRLIRDQLGRKLYNSDSELADAMGVGSIVDVPLMETATTADGEHIIGIIVNLKDYTVGTNKGGQTKFFDDFDIDFNQYKYLYETRLSGALTRYDSAIIITASREITITGDVATDEDTLLGSVKASELQEDVVISKTNNISGTLKYKTGFKEFSTNPEEQDGHFLALKFSTNGKTDIYATLLNGHSGKTKLTDDGILIVRIEDEMSQRLKIETTKDGKTKTVTYSLSGLTLEKPKK